MKIFKQGLVQTFGFFGWCSLMCSVAIGFLIASGGLLLLANEGRQKTFLIPLLLILGGIIFWYRKNKKHCAQKGCETMGDMMLKMTLYMAISILTSVLFMLYIFIPWWIPGYQGGALQP